MKIGHHQGQPTSLLAAQKAGRIGRPQLWMLPRCQNRNFEAGKLRNSGKWLIKISISQKNPLLTPEIYLLKMLVMKNIPKMIEMMNTNTIKILSIRGKIFDKVSMELLMLILPMEPQNEHLKPMSLLILFLILWAWTFLENICKDFRR